jgi:hypothetical protein
MSGPKRTVLARRMKPVITDEMIDLYRRGCEIKAARADERWRTKAVGATNFSAS